jgi:hypothetical protein
MVTTYRVYYAKDFMQGYTDPAFKASEYKQVAFVEADDLNDLFRQMNVIHGDEDELPLKLKVRSMSCGDVAVCQTTEKAWFCAPGGWVEVTPTV